MTQTIDQILGAARRRLRAAPAPSASASLDAAVLLCAALECRRSDLIAHGERAVSPHQAQAFEHMLARRVAGEPVAYILGVREFWSLALQVSPATLIPRPDTETLVLAALERMPADAPLKVLDLGTGSGAIALALAQERPNAVIIGTDRSADALAIASANGARHAPGRIDWRLGSWYDAVTDADRFDLIVSNPPYVCDDDAHLASGDLRFEPRGALAAGHDGLNDLREIVAPARRHLAPSGWLLVEHGATQAAAVAALCVDAALDEISGVCDLAGQPRVTAGRRLR